MYGPLPLREAAATTQSRRGVADWSVGNVWEIEVLGGVTFLFLLSGSDVLRS